MVITDGDVKARAIAPLPSTWCVAIPCHQDRILARLIRCVVTGPLPSRGSRNPPDMVSADGRRQRAVLGQPGHYFICYPLWFEP